MAGLSDRPTSDLVVLILATAVGLVILFTGLGLTVLEFVRPAADVAVAVQAFQDVVAAITGAVIGYIAGRGTVRP